MPENFEQIVRPHEAPTKAPGHSPSATRGLYPDTPTIVIGDEGKTTNDDGAARRDQPNNMNYWPTFGFSVGGAENVVLKRTVSGSYDVDLDVSGVHRIDVQGSSLAITFTDLPALPPEQEETIYADRERCFTVELVIRWITAGTRTVTLADVVFTDGEAPEFATAAGGIDVIIVQIFSDGLKLGFMPGAAMVEPN